MERICLGWGVAVSLRSAGGGVIGLEGVCGSQSQLIYVWRITECVFYANMKLFVDLMVQSTIDT